MMCAGVILARMIQETTAIRYRFADAISGPSRSQRYF
jgi:hypothetical protein